MARSDQPYREIEVLRERLSRLSAVSRRINKGLDFDTVLRGVLDSTLSLTAVRYGVMTPCRATMRTTPGTQSPNPAPSSA